MSTRPGHSRARAGLDTIGVWLLIFGLSLVGFALFAAIDPHAFFQKVGGFGPYNDHYIHDVAAFQGAVGVFLLLAIRQRGWRIPALAVALLFYGLHALAHLVDINEAHSRAVGIFDFAALAVAAVILAWLLRRASRAP